MVCNGLHRGNIADMDEVSMDLFRPDDQIPRFTVHILDQKLKGSNGKFAVFIVPQGRLVRKKFQIFKSFCLNGSQFAVKRNGYFQRHRVVKNCYSQLNMNV